MNPIIIGICGGYSGAGKTTIACEILKNVAGWGAIKYTKTSFYSSIIHDEESLSVQGKDTKRMMDAGAAKVLWVQSSADELAETASMAVQMLSDLEGIVVEGNGMIEVLSPDVVVFVSGSGEKVKSGAERVLHMADIVIEGDTPVEGIPAAAKRFHKDDTGRCIQYLLERVKNIR
jgi:molybdopterin-guanine dinucleotide biosynthesis protein